MINYQGRNLKIQCDLAQRFREDQFQELSWKMTTGSGPHSDLNYFMLGWGSFPAALNICYRLFSFDLPHATIGLLKECSMVMTAVLLTTVGRRYLQCLGKKSKCTDYLDVDYSLELFEHLEEWEKSDQRIIKTKLELFLKKSSYAIIPKLTPLFAS